MRPLYRNGHLISCFGLPLSKPPCQAVTEVATGSGLDALVEIALKLAPPQAVGVTTTPASTSTAAPEAAPSAAPGPSGPALRVKVSLFSFSVCLVATSTPGGQRERNLPHATGRGGKGEMEQDKGEMEQHKSGMEHYKGEMERQRVQQHLSQRLPLPQGSRASPSESRAVSIWTVLNCFRRTSYEEGTPKCRRRRKPKVVSAE
jgi:hypothetical protein